MFLNRMSEAEKIERTHELHQEQKKIRGFYGMHATKIIAILVVFAVVWIVVYSTWQKEADYNSTFHEIADIVNIGKGRMEETGETLLDTWVNAQDEEKELEALYQEPEFAEDIALYEENLERLSELKENLQNPPKGAAENNPYILSMVESYENLCHLFVEPEGTYEEVSDAYSEYSEDLTEQIDALNQQMMKSQQK